MQEIALWPSTNLSICDISVLAGSESTITEIAGYTYLYIRLAFNRYVTASPLKASRIF